jgi:hypothetical protein
MTFVCRFSCHGSGGNQAWTLTNEGELRHDDLCVVATQSGRDASFRDCPDDVLPKSYVRFWLFVVCSLLIGGETVQVWEWTSGRQLRNSETNLCLEMAAPQSNAAIKLSSCMGTNPFQIWAFSNQ